MVLPPDEGEQKTCEGILHAGAKFYEPLQLKKKVQDHPFQVLSIKSTPLGYFLIGRKGFWLGMTQFYRGRTIRR